MHHRRTFLQSVATGLAAAAVAPAAERKRKMTIDLVCGMLGVKANLDDSIELAHRHGFESVAPLPQDLELVDTPLTKLLARMKRLNLVFGAASLPTDFRRDQSTFAAGLKTLPRTAEVLQIAGVTRLGTWVRPAHEELTYLANFKQHTSRLREVAKILGDHGIRFGLEYVGPKTSWTAARHSFVHSMAEMKELIAAIDRPNVSFVLDSWHWYTAGETEADLLTLTNRDVVACDLNDAPAGLPRDRQMDNSRELPCATGVIDVKTFLGALVKIGYDGPVRAEPFNAALRKLPADEAVAATARAMKKAFALVD